MIKNVKRIWNKFRINEFSEDVFSINEKEIKEINQDTISVVGLVSSILTGILWFASFFLSQFKENRNLYFLIAIIMIICLLINHFYVKKGNRAGNILIYSMLFSIYMFGILLGSMSLRDENATAICVLLTVLPMFFIAHPMKINLISTVSYVIFYILAIQYKENAIVNHDIINATIYLILGYFVCYYSVRTKLENIIARKELKDQRDIDFLTNLLNRGAAQKRVDDFLESCDRLSVMLLLDIDNFKGVNDTYGHDKGDEILIETALLLASVFEPKGIISRVGGDEFVVFIPEIKDLSELYEKIEKIIKEMKRDIREEGKHCLISASIGIALAPEDGDTFEKIYKSADIAMYNAKKNGKCAYAIFNK